MYSTLHVTVHRARKLYDAAYFETQDPYVKLSLKHLGKGDKKLKKMQKYSTKVDKNAHKTPKWNQSFNFAIPVGKEPSISLKIKVLDRNHVSDDAVIGFNTLNIAPLIDGIAREKWYPLYRKSKLTGGKRSAGEILLRFHLTKGATQHATTVSVAPPLGGAAIYSTVPLNGTTGQKIFNTAYQRPQPATTVYAPVQAVAAAPAAAPVYAAATPVYASATPVAPTTAASYPAYPAASAQAQVYPAAAAQAQAYPAAAAQAQAYPAQYASAAPATQPRSLYPNF